MVWKPQQGFYLQEPAGSAPPREMVWPSPSLLSLGAWASPCLPLFPTNPPITPVAEVAPAQPEGAVHHLLPASLALSAPQHCLVGPSLTSSQHAAHLHLWTLVRSVFLSSAQPQKSSQLLSLITRGCSTFTYIPTSMSSPPALAAFALGPCKGWLLWEAPESSGSVSHPK